ncbi:MAG: hypothetical protein VW741_06770 [Flammeovirgaceae bacterium]|jgi:hypothetical protein
MIKKFFILIVFSSFSFKSFTQSYSINKEHYLSYKDSLNLYYLGLDIKNTKYDHLKLRHLISLHKKSRLNNVIGSVIRTGGYIFGGIGVLFLATAPSQNTGLGQGISVLLGASFLSVGSVGYGISVPFKSASKRRAFERDYMIQKMKEEKKYMDGN